MRADFARLRGEIIQAPPAYLIFRSPLDLVLWLLGASFTAGAFFLPALMMGGTDVVLNMLGLAALALAIKEFRSSIRFQQELDKLTQEI